jgi:exonuclease III
MEFEDDMREYVSSLAKKKSEVYTGDLIVAHCPIDIKNPIANEGKAGYSF